MLVQRIAVRPERQTGFGLFEIIDPDIIRDFRILRELLIIETAFHLRNSSAFPGEFPIRTFITII